MVQILILLFLLCVSASAQILGVGNGGTGANASSATAHTVFGNLTSSPAAAAFSSDTTTINTSSPLGGGGTFHLGGTLTLTCTTCSTTTGTVTSIATTSPITGGTITTTGTLTCGTCVVASSPGAGVAHFAGSTQTVTSSAVDLTGADVTGILPGANGGVTASPAYTSVATSPNGAGAQIHLNSLMIESVWIPFSVTFSNIMFDVQTADNSANVYDAGIYGPGCNASGTNVPLAAHIGPASYTTTGIKTAATSGGSKTITPGWYCLAWTGNASVISIGYGSDWKLVQFSLNTSYGSSSGGTLPSTITAPATAVSFVANREFMALY